MLKNDQLDQMIKGILGELPEGLKTLQSDLEKHLQIALRHGLRKLDLVSRDEFDVQQAVLARTREKLEAMVQPAEDLVGSQDPDEGSGQFDGKRHAIQTAADRGDDRGIGVMHRKCRIHFSGPSVEERDGVKPKHLSPRVHTGLRRRERRTRVSGFTAYP